MKKQALIYLRNALENSQASFRDGQWDSIKKLLDHQRVLVVQRTGWGKSMVYFLATKLLRDQGSGLTLLISPLLSLMRNQLQAAARIGVVARTINSTNADEWDHILSEVENNQVDVLLISPERLANDKFRQSFLDNLAAHIGLFVIDEAHCISDWGHDFRPDYQRIVRILEGLPPNIPVLATTATANNRVVADVMAQLGHDIVLQRGSLVRTSLKLQNIIMPSSAARLAWLAQKIPALTGSGIVYTLTQRDAERVTQWLRLNHINAKTYHAGIIESRASLEQQLLNNDIKVLVATVALGMGFDKPDLGFVIHYQRPASVVHYYQQVGRAGRAVKEALGILLCGDEDDFIADYFIRNAFPPHTHLYDIIRVLGESKSGLSVPAIQRVLNLKKSQIDKALKFMTLALPAPITKNGSNWLLAPSADSYYIDKKHALEITNIRRAEQQQMRDYMLHKGCLMAFLQKALDDPNPSDCGKCANCNPGQLLDDQYDFNLANRAGIFLDRSYQSIQPRRKWPPYKPLPIYGFATKIPANLQASEGRALSLLHDAGWGELVAHGKKKGSFSDKLVLACVELLRQWRPACQPKWLTCIPSFQFPNLVPDFAARLADALGLPFIACIEQERAKSPQAKMSNSYQQAKNLDGVYIINDECLPDACLLIDDIVESRWTLTVATALLRQAGCSAVIPLTLSMTSYSK